MKSAPRVGKPLRARRAGPAAIACLAALALAASPALRAQSVTKGLDDLRNDRLSRSADKQEARTQAVTEVWTISKIVVNINARCPVISALGYFGAFATDDKDPAKAAELRSRYAQFQKDVQPIASEIKQMATSGPIIGAEFPPGMDKRLATLSAQLNQAVIKQYGEDALRELQKFVAAENAGSVVGRSSTPAAPVAATP